MKTVVHRPKPTKCAAQLRGFAGRFREGVDLHEWEMPEDKAKIVSKVLLERLDDRVRHRAMRTLVVAVLDKGHSRAFAALRMVWFSDGSRELGRRVHRLGLHVRVHQTFVKNVGACGRRGVMTDVNSAAPARAASTGARCEPWGCARAACFSDSGAPQIS